LRTRRSSITLRRREKQEELKKRSNIAGFAPNLSLKQLTSCILSELSRHKSQSSSTRGLSSPDKLKIRKGNPRVHFDNFITVQTGFILAVYPEMPSRSVSIERSDRYGFCDGSVALYFHSSREATTSCADFKIACEGILSDVQLFCNFHFSLERRAIVS